MMLKCEESHMGLESFLVYVQIYELLCTWDVQDMSNLELHTIETIETILYIYNII